MEDWSEIRRLYVNEGLSGREIARRLGVARATVARAVKSDQLPLYQRRPRGSSTDVFDAQIRRLVLERPSIPATVIAERVGFNGGVCTTVFRQKVAQIKRELLPPDPADRLVFAPGEQVQCDLWFPGSQVGGRSHPVLVMVASFSRFLQAVMLPSRQCGDILYGMNVLLSRFGGLPQRLLWDNEAGLVSRRRLIPQAARWAGSLGADIRLARPKDPETKGRVERANGYLETSFEPARQFGSIPDFNSQLDDWLDARANQRYHRAAGGRPVDLVKAERERFRLLPDQLPRAVIEYRCRLARDYHLRVCGNDYSMSPQVIGRFVDVEASWERVRGWCDGLLVADHARRLDVHGVITDPAHVAQAARLRGQFQALHARQRDKYGRLASVESRDLADYDRLFQVTS